MLSNESLGATFVRAAQPARRAHRQTVHGVYGGSVSMFERFVAALEQTKIRPVLDRVFRFERARDAYEHLASAQHLGKVVLSVA